MEISLPDLFLSHIPLSDEEKRKFIQSLNNSPATSIRINPLKSATIQEANAVAWSRFGYYLDERPVFTLDPLFHAGAYYVQEASSMFVEQVITQLSLDKQPLRILDACASPGGKTTHLLSLLHPDSLIVANESIRSRQQALIHNIIKWGKNNVVVTNSDTGRFSALKSYFDVILCDAPCSGEGLFRKDEQAVNHWSEENVKHCSLRQQRIVNELWPSLKPGGIFIYSTCTYNEQENEKNIAKFLNDFDATCEKLNIENYHGIEEHTDSAVTSYRFYPHKIKGEGFTISIIRKGTEGESAHYRPGKAEDIDLKIRRQAADYIQNADDSYMFMHQQTVRFIPKQLKNELTLLKAMYITHAGTAIATIKGKDWIPDAELALSTALKETFFNTTETDALTALHLLKGDTQLTTELAEGHALVKHQGLPLMFVKKTGRRINNLYPREWYIRMKVDK